ncbi:MAG: hypothetical protein JW915_13395 [Chitinispirillaceae bacterium]|nr:hypothetical protein [Chitinispirillaceae bacterium]
MVITRTNLPVILPMILFAGLYSSAGAAAEDMGPFFDTLEMSLRHQYVYCTGDSSYRNRSEILIWKRNLDIFAESDSFKTITKKFFTETGLSPSKIRVCDIVNWYRSHSDGNSESILLLENDIRKRDKRKADSLLIDSICAHTTASPFDFDGIPFGISRKLFKVMMDWKYPQRYEDNGKTIQCKGVEIDNISGTAAFHFDKDGIYRMYEIECSGGPLDSLNTKVRNEVTSLGSMLEGKSGIAPDHIYRIGRFDITQGRLTVERLWKKPPVSAFVGIATYRYHYYGKAVVLANAIKKTREN